MLLVAGNISSALLCPGLCRSCTRALQLSSPHAPSVVFQWFLDLDLQGRAGLPAVARSAGENQAVVRGDAFRRCIVRDMLFR